MITAFTSNGWEDYAYWQTHNPEIANKIMDLLKAIHRDPFIGIGRPTLLAGVLEGYWSRRITGGHRLVYRISGTSAALTIIVLQARFHYLLDDSIDS